VRDGFLSTDAEDPKPFEGVPFSTMILLSRARFTSDLESQGGGNRSDEEPKFLVGPVFRKTLPSKFNRDALCVDIVSPNSPGTLLRLINCTSTSSRTLSLTVPNR